MDQTTNRRDQKCNCTSTTDGYRFPAEYIPHTLNRPLKSLFSPRGDRLQQPACSSQWYSPLGKIRTMQLHGANLHGRARRGETAACMARFCTSTWPIKLFCRCRLCGTEKILQAAFPGPCMLQCGVSLVRFEKCLETDHGYEPTNVTVLRRVVEKNENTYE
jgi:hypothetical protein